MGHEELQIFQRWETFLDWLLNQTEKFPKRVRFTFSTRLDNFALDILEMIIEASYTKEKLDALRRINLHLEKMRVLVRICNKRKILANKHYEHAIRELYAVGRMNGGWIKQQQERK